MHLKIAKPVLVITPCKRSLGQGNVFTGVCLSTGEGPLYDVTSCLTPMFLLGGLCPWSHVPSRGFLSRAGLCPARGVYVQSGLYKETPPLESEKRAVRILLECFLISAMFSSMTRLVPNLLKSVAMRPERNFSYSVVCTCSIIKFHGVKYIHNYL